MATHRMTVANMRDYARQERDRAKRDMDKTGDIDSYNYYQGLYDAFNAIFTLHMKED